MSRTLFIADLHLCQEEPAITAGFLHFLQGEAQQCDALYILGDLFEAWIGDDDPNPLHQQIADALRALPVPKFFIHGNRDFLLGQQFARASGMTLLPEEQVLERYGQRVLMMHGDTLCTDDHGYQRFRAKVHQRWLQREKQPLQPAGQPAQVTEHHGRQPAGGSRGNDAPAGADPDSRPHPSSGDSSVRARRHASATRGAGRVA